MEDNELAQNIKTATLNLRNHITKAQKAGLDVDVTFSKRNDLTYGGTAIVTRQNKKERNGYLSILREDFDK